MEKSENIKKLLLSTHKEKILEGIDLFEANRVKELIPELFKIYQTNTDAEIQSRILFLLAETKITTGVPFIIEGLKSVDNFELNPELIRVCWENGLNYSEHLDFFCSIFIHSSFIPALEAFTVIEENISFAEKKLIQNCIKDLKKNENKIDTKKTDLYKELLKIMESNS